MSSTGQSARVTKRPRPLPLRRQAREIVYNVHKFLGQQKKKFSLEYNTVKVTAEATGVSKSTVERIVREGRSSLAAGGTSTPSFSNPNKKYGGQNKIEWGSYREGLVRRKIEEYYEMKKEYPSAEKLLNALKEDGIILCGKEVLRKKMKEIIAKWKSCQCNGNSVLDSVGCELCTSPIKQNNTPEPNSGAHRPDRNRAKK